MKKKIQGLHPINLRPGGPVKTTTVRPDNADADPYNDPDVRSKMAESGGVVNLPRSAKKKVLGLKPNTGTSDQSRFNHLKGK